MKQRFSISRNTGGGAVVIKEYAELDKGAFSLLCEVSYAVEAVEAALKKGPAHVIALLRTESFFPTSHFAEKLTACLADYLGQGAGDSVRIDADDYECIHRAGTATGEEESGDLDELLTDVTEDLIADDQPVEKLDAPIKIAEDETVEISDSL